MVTFIHVLAGIAIYLLIILSLKKKGYLSKSVSLYGPIVQLHSQHGLNLIEKISSKKRFWRVWGSAGYILALGGLVSSFLLIVFAAEQTLRMPEQQVISEPRNMLVIPGVNDFLPLEAAGELVIGLLLALVVHEGGHAIMCRIADMDIDSTGLVFIGPIPMGAFVQPDEESVQRASIISRLRMYSGGVMNNMALSVILLVLLAGPMLSVVAPAPGAGVDGVVTDGPADIAEIAPGDRITAIDGTPIASNDEFNNYIRQSDSPQLLVEIDGERTTTVERSVIIRAVPASLSELETGDHITHLNGERVQTTAGFERVLQESEGVVTVETETGKNVQLTAGALVYPQPEQALSSSIGDTEGPLLITQVGDYSVKSSSDLTAALDEYTVGETIVVTTVSNGEESENTVVLGESEGEAFLGVSTVAGTSGIETTDFGAALFPTEDFLNILKQSSESTVGWAQRMFLTLFLPFASIAGFSTNFPGFTPYVQNFYVAQGVPTALVPLWFFTASAMFWTIWVNVNLAIFNCLPTVFLDGGYILRDSLALLSEKLPLPTEAAQTYLSYGIMAITGIAVLTLLFAPQILL